jgi:hypothetical protein
MGVIMFKVCKRQFSKFQGEADLSLALVKSGFLHARKVGFNDDCLVEACRDYGYPSVNEPSIFR